MRRARPFVVAIALVGALVAGSVHAQTATQGRITGDVTLGTDGATLDLDELAVDFIILEGAQIGGSLIATVDEGGAFSLDVPLEGERRYVPRVVYQGVSYIGAPVTVTEEQPEAIASVPPVYETTSETPDLTIGETVVTVVALDRGAGELGFIREDFVLNPSDRVYVGGENRVTLRLPTPERTTDALGENADGAFALEEGILTTTVPIRAGGGTSIITRYLVTYDIAEDAYVLRVTTPVAAERIVMRIPDDYVRDLEVLGAGAEGEGEFFEVAEGDPVPLRTVVLEGAGPGDSLVVRLDGLAFEQNHNPLAEMPGSLIAGAIALVMIGAAAAFVVARRPEPQA